MDTIYTSTVPAAKAGPKPHRCDLTPAYMNDQFVPKTMDYAKVARAYEKYGKDNSTFNGKSLSDNRPVSNFYKIKGQGADAVYKKAPIVQQIENDKKQNLPDPNGQNYEKTPMYSQKMLDMLCDDDAAIKVSKLPSNLTEVPRVHEKYEINSFCGTNPQYRANLKTMEIISNNRSGQAILNLNPGFFGGVSQQAKQPVDLKDPYADILDKQTAWQNVNKVGPTAGGIDLVNYSELYHPLSHHNVACGNNRANQMPSDLLEAQNKAKLVQKGFYDKEALELVDGYPHAKTMDYKLRQLDPRLSDNQYMLGQPNAAVQVNQGLMAEILHSQHQREFERGLRSDPPIPLNRPKPVYSQTAQQQVAPPSLEYEPNAMHQQSRFNDQHQDESHTQQSNLKEKSFTSSVLHHQGDRTNRTTVPSQLNGNNTHDQSTNSMLMMQDHPTSSGITPSQTVTVQQPPMGVSNSMVNAQQPSSLQAQDVDDQRSMFQMQMNGGMRSLGPGEDDQSSPEASPERMAPQMEHLDSSPSVANGSLQEQQIAAMKIMNMDDQCRHEMQPNSQHQPFHNQSQQSSQYGGKRSVRFDGTSMGSQSQGSPEQLQNWQKQQQMAIQEANEERQEDYDNERDSEEPDDEADDTMYQDDYRRSQSKAGEDSELLEDRYRAMDPSLEQKIEQIRQGRLTQEDQRYDQTSATNNVVSKASLAPPSTHNAATTVDDQSTNKNLSKLEEVLRRQRERLESMSGSFGGQNNPSHQQNQQVSVEDQNQRSSGYNHRVSQQSQLSSQVSPNRSSPLRHTQGQQSEGVYSSSTNNLEKAYEDLEREILEIKMKLQGSSLGPGQQEQEETKHAQVSRDSQFAMPDGQMAQSMGSAGMQRNQVAQMATGTFQPAQSLTQQHHQRHAGIYHDPNSASRTVGARSSQRSPNRSGTHGGNLTQGAADLEEHDYSLSVSDLNSNSLYRSGRYGGPPEI